MLERLHYPLNRLLDWQRRRFFREEEWRVTVSTGTENFAHAVETEADNGLLLLMMLPKFLFNRAFVGRIRDSRVALNIRIRPLIWPAGPGSYNFSGELGEMRTGNP